MKNRQCFVMRWVSIKLLLALFLFPGTSSVFSDDADKLKTDPKAKSKEVFKDSSVKSVDSTSIDSIPKHLKGDKLILWKVNKKKTLTKEEKKRYKAIREKQRLERARKKKEEERKEEARIRKRQDESASEMEEMEEESSYDSYDDDSYDRGGTVITTNN